MNSNMNIQGLRDFLISTSTKLRSEGVSNENTQLNIVLGNESADLDSILSAILYAYYKQLKSNENEGIYVPIVNVPQEDLSLRKELLFLLKPSHIEETSIVCIDQFNKFFPSNQFNSNINSLQLKSVVLVDHNRLIDSEKEFTPIVTEVIDHHADETHFLPNLSKKVIETVGSCTTLLSEIFLNDKSINIDNQIAKLLLATILVDTVNFDESAKKTTAKDVDMATLLTKIANVDSLSNDLFQKNLFDEVNKEKSNIDSFTTNELLRKDYKEWVITSNSNSNSYHLGMASTKISVQAWIKKDSDLTNQFNLFCEQKNLKILFIGTEFFDENNTYNREGILYLTKDNSKLFADLTQFIAESFSAANVSGDYHFSDLNGAFIAVFHLDPSISRKVLSPKLVDFLSA